MKWCRYCKQYKPLTEFYRDGSARDGCRSRCRACQAKATEQRWKNMPLVEKERHHIVMRERYAQLSPEKRRQRLADMRERRKKLPPEYGSWRSMIKRCTNVNHPFYSYYGGRGIKVCDRWVGKEGFSHFMNDLGSKPFPKAQLDRIDNDGDYGPNNCRWATSAENCRNRRNTKLDVNSVRLIRQLYSEGGFSQAGLGVRFRVSQSLIYFVVHNHIWKEETL